MIDYDHKKVILGLSGGVDSAVAAQLLIDAGYEVIGTCLKMCQPEAEIEDARAVAAALGISFHVIDMSEGFKRNVLDDFASEYANGRTPNPCLRCNRLVKWEGLLSLADELRAYYVATGHYARVIKHESSFSASNASDSQVGITESQTEINNLQACALDSQTDISDSHIEIINSQSDSLESQSSTLDSCSSTFLIGKGLSDKDQSYALYALTSSQLARTLLPLGDKSKEEIRELASNIKLPVANKKDSQDICFVPDGDYAGFLSKNYCVSDVPGNFVRTDGTVLGPHKGISHYTVGQRRGLGIAAEQSLYVISICRESGDVVLGFEDEVYRDSLVCNNLNILVPDIPENFSVFCKIRYNHRGECGRITKLSENEIRCEFDHPVKGVAPGQAAVFYKDDCIIAGGTIV